MIDFLVPRGYIFSSLNELSKVLSVGVTESRVKITNEHGQTLHGNISDKTVIENIKSLKGSACSFGASTWCCWNTSFNFPSTPSPIKKRNGVEWYLIYFSCGFIGVERSCDIHGNMYLLAELSVGTSGFQTASGYKIEIE